MKVAVSIPDPVFAEAERLAKRLKTTRSQIYARALDAFVGTHAPDRVTQAMNEVVDAVGGAPDAFVQAATRRVLDRIEW
jgi:antitoxin MazE6